MDDAERLKRGEAARRRVLGDAQVDRSIKSRNAFNAEWIDWITRNPWHDVWTRPHFDDRTRRVLVIGTMMSLGRWEEFRLHVRAALTAAASRPTTSRRSSSSRRTIAACRPAIMPCAKPNPFCKSSARCRRARTHKNARTISCGLGEAIRPPHRRGARQALHMSSASTACVQSNACIIRWCAAISSSTG